MTTPPGNQIKKLRTQKGLSQAQLAEAVGAHWITISKLERGKSRLTQEWMNKISKAMGVSASDLITASPALYDVSMQGVLTEHSGQIRLEMQDPAWTSSQSMRVELGSFQGDRDIWVTVATNRFYPYIHSGDFVRFTYLRDVKQVETLINRLCLVHIQHKPLTLIGFLRWIGKEQAFDLDVPGSTPVRNVQIEEIAGATIIVGRPQLV